MKRTFVTFALAAFGLTAPALAGPLEEQFFAMDTSRDGTISRSEFVNFQKEKGASERQANFAFDNTAAGDNSITLTEYRAGPVSRTERRAQPVRQQTQQQPRFGKAQKIFLAKPPPTP